jgi:hypothetical protein
MKDVIVLQVVTRTSGDDKGFDVISSAVMSLAEYISNRKYMRASDIIAMSDELNKHGKAWVRSFSKGYEDRRWLDEIVIKIQSYADVYPSDSDIPF